MSEHTPGPWHQMGRLIVGGEGTERAAVVAILSDSRTTDAEPFDFLSASDERTAIVNANADLIEAAPELLDQLKESTEILADLLAGRNVTGRILDCLDSNRAAIAKARGE